MRKIKQIEEYDLDFVLEHKERIRAYFINLTKKNILPCVIFGVLISSALSDPTSIEYKKNLITGGLSGLAFSIVASALCTGIKSSNDIEEHIKEMEEDDLGRKLKL